MNKTQALAEFLNADVEDIEQNGDFFTINQRKEKRGTSPEEAQRLVSQLREALDKAGFPGLTRLQMYEAAGKYKPLRELSDKHKKNLEELKNGHSMQKCQKLFKEAYGQSHFARLKPVTRKDVVTCFPPQARVKYTRLFDEMEAAEKTLAETNAKIDALPVYHSITKAMQEHCPEMLKIGTHEVVNTLYFISPDYEDNSDHALTLREAFDGAEPKDQRTLYQVDDGEYQVLTDEEADEAATEYIKYSLWAFNADFLAAQTDMPAEIFKALGEKCEDGNDAVLKIVEKTCGLETLVQKAIKADGRGHFLNTYDGEENQHGDFFIYRTN